MKTKNRKKYFFTCAAIINQNLVAETYFIESREDAYREYEIKHGICPQFLDGPFYRKLEKNKREVQKNNIKLTNKIVRGMYKDYVVKGVVLKEPKDYIYLIFVDNKDKNTNVINGSNIVHVSEIKGIL